MWSTGDVQQKGTFDVRSGPPSNLGHYAVAVGAVCAAIAVTRFTWPLIDRMPFALLFAAVFVGARWTTERASLLSIAWRRWARP